MAKKPGNTRRNLTGWTGSLKDGKRMAQVTRIKKPVESVPSVVPVPLGARHVFFIHFVPCFSR